MKDTSLPITFFRMVDNYFINDSLSIEITKEDVCNHIITIVIYMTLESEPYTLKLFINTLDIRLSFAEQAMKSFQYHIEYNKNGTDK